MLAVVTKMSLTQVSTWFANARRRLKKENKATWSMALDQSFSDIDEPFMMQPGAEPLHETGFDRSGLPPSPDMLNLGSPKFSTSAEEKKTIEIASAEKRGHGKIWSIAEMTDEK